MWGFLLAMGLVAAQSALATPVNVMRHPPLLAGKDAGVAKLAEVPDTTEGLKHWLAGFRGRALANGILAATFERAFRNVSYNEAAIARDRNQSEFSRSIWDYLDSVVSEQRLENGKRALERHRDVLDRIEATYGVDKAVVVAIWGMESSYGAFRGDQPLIGSLATLAYDGRRGQFFEQQLIAALQIVQSGDVSAAEMTGSWAGAMGHTQFIPTSYLAFAVDFTGDGKRDIWSDDPTDALASTAAYLAKSGWQAGRPWGIEVKLPSGFDYAQTAKRIKKTAAEWQALGVHAVDGGPLPDQGAASVLLPAGARGAAFLTFGNFTAIERYNAADAYVIGVGHLSDRLKGGAAIQTAWPREDRSLTADERQELQSRLTRAGFDSGGVDGKIGPNTIAAVRAFQRSVGVVPDGYASLEILERLR
ncbi:MAG: lytic murein transglycosylase [Paracoccaceae bacterium]|nr:lytic murein transglycosylase [Paracoccaceae bacterium]